MRRLFKLQCCPNLRLPVLPQHSKLPMQFFERVERFLPRTLRHWFTSSQYCIMWHCQWCVLLPHRKYVCGFKSVLSFSKSKRQHLCACKLPGAVSVSNQLPMGVFVVRGRIDSSWSMLLHGLFDRRFLCCISIGLHRHSVPVDGMDA
jgi:hypothetical protein